jgi:hypothetical protein
MKVAVSIPDEVVGISNLSNTFRLHRGPGVYPASNINEYQKIFLRVKRGWCVRLTISPPFVMICLTDSNALFLVEIFSFKILFVSLVPC